MINDVNLTLMYGIGFVGGCVFSLFLLMTYSAILNKKIKRIKSYEIELIEKEQAIKIINLRYDYITLDFPNKNAWKSIKKFIEDSEKIK